MFSVEASYRIIKLNHVQNIQQYSFASGTPSLKLQPSYFFRGQNCFCIHFLAQLSRPASAQPIGLPSLAIVAKSYEDGNQLVAAGLVLSAPLCSTTIDLG